MSRYKRWMIAGGVTGAFTAALFIGLAAVVFASNPPMTPGIIVIALLDVLLGGLTTCLLVGGNMCRWVTADRDEFGKQRWWKGYSAAVEDLKGDADVLQLPPPAARSGRQG